MAVAMDIRSSSTSDGGLSGTAQNGQAGSWQAADERQVQVRFTTKLPPKFRVTTAPFAVPGHLTRYGLSEVINTLLQLETPKPFDFLVDGELVRGSLEKLLVEKKLSAETILSVEYIPAIVPPQKEQTISHDDWISAVSGSLSSAILTGSYDCSGRLCDLSGVCLATLTGHSDAITSITVLPPSTFEEGGVATRQVATASKDRTLRLWNVPTAVKQTTEERTVIHPVRVFIGHKEAVQAVSASPVTDKFCSASWDCTLKIWQADKEPSDGSNDANDVSAKRRKAADGEAVSGEGETKQVGAIATLSGHTQCVSSVAWLHPQTIYSGSWDHSIRSWDVETNVYTLILTGRKAVHCLSVQEDEESGLIAAGGADSTLRLWDPRASDTAAPVMQLSSHKSWITAVKWSRRTPNLLLSSSNDSTVKIWDTRSKIPLHTISDHTDKVLCVDWCGKDSIASGGADRHLRIHALSKQS